MCECVAGFGSTAAQPHACSPCALGTFQPNPLHPAAAVAALVSSHDDDAAPLPPRDLVNAAPNYKPCTPCGEGFSTAQVQSTSRAACVRDCPCGG